MSAGAIRPSGWYDDATDGTLLRYWDGAGWTPHTCPRDGRAGLAEPTRSQVSEPEPEPEPGREHDLALTARLPHVSSTPDHTTVPTPPAPATPPAPTLHLISESASPPLLPVVGAVTAAASLVVALAALGVALGR